MAGGAGFNRVGETCGRYVCAGVQNGRDRGTSVPLRVIGGGGRG